MLIHLVRVQGFRELLPGEYTQMSGRAGRRGLDDVGIVFLSVGDGDAIPSEHSIKTMLKGRSTRLSCAALSNQEAHNHAEWPLQPPRCSPVSTMVGVADRSSG